MTTTLNPELNKKIGVALSGPDWAYLLAFLMHTVTDKELVVDLWETKEDCEEMEFLIRQIQRQVFLVTEKIKLEAGGNVDDSKGLGGKILSLKNKLIGADGRPLT